MADRVSGTKIFHSVEALKNAGLAIASPQDPKYQQSSNIASIAETFQHILDHDGTKFWQQKNVGTVENPIMQNTNQLITFKRTDIAREGGSDDDIRKIDRNVAKIGRDGLFEISGAGDADYKLTHAVEVYKQDHSDPHNIAPAVLQTLADGAVGMSVFYRGSNVSRVRANCGSEINALICLNGMRALVDIFVARHKQTKNWTGLDENDQPLLNGPRQLIYDGLQGLANSFETYGANVAEMQARTVTEAQLNTCLISASKMKVNGANIVSWSDLQKVHSLYNDKKSQWFADDKPTAWRLYNSFTRYAESQNSMPNREKILQGAYWPMARAGIIDLPEHVAYKNDFEVLGESASQLQLVGAN